MSTVTAIIPTVSGAASRMSITIFAKVRRVQSLLLVAIGERGFRRTSVVQRISGVWLGKPLSAITLPSQ
jgi:hypothetical protein